jgi:hypothetical protein
MFRLIAALAAFSAVAGAYMRFLRPRVLNWNATADEAARAMPGDEIVAGSALQTTRAVTVDAPPSAIWPWLVQMGPRPRAGAYTYDWIERRLGIDIENSDRVLPEFQHLEPGDWIGLNEKGQGIEVREVQPERALVLQWMPQRSTWAFVLEPVEGGATRLISRNRLPVTGPLVWLGMIVFMEPGSLIMERKMLLGIKQRAERLPREGALTPAGQEVGPA